MAAIYQHLINRHINVFQRLSADAAPNFCKIGKEAASYARRRLTGREIDASLARDMCELRREASDVDCRETTGSREGGHICRYGAYLACAASYFFRRAAAPLKPAPSTIVRM